MIFGYCRAPFLSADCHSLRVSFHSIPVEPLPSKVIIRLLELWFLDES
jgi:hypothetical protein